MNDKKAVKKPMKSMKDIVESQQGEILKALPKHMDAGRFLRTIITTMKLTPKLYECNWQSVVGAIFTMAQVGLEPVGGQAHLIPFGKECVLVIGYHGYKELFYRHNSAVSLSMDTVFQGDIFDYEYGTNAHLTHIPKEKTEKPTFHYAIATVNSGTTFIVWSHEKCIAHGEKHSKSFNSKSSPWQTNTNAMCRKTVLLQLSKRIPLSYEIQRAVAADESIRNFVPGTQDFMDLPDTAWNDVTENKESEPYPEGPPPEPEAKSESEPEPEPKEKKKNGKKEKPPTDDEKSDLMDVILKEMGQQTDLFLSKVSIKSTDDIKTREQFNGITACLRETIEGK